MLAPTASAHLPSVSSPAPAAFASSGVALRRRHGVGAIQVPQPVAEKMPLDIAYDVDLPFCKCGKAECDDILEYQRAAAAVAAAAADKKVEVHC